MSYSFSLGIKSYIWLDDHKNYTWYFLMVYLWRCLCKSLCCRCCNGLLKRRRWSVWWKTSLGKVFIGLLFCIWPCPSCSCSNSVIFRLKSTCKLKSNHQWKIIIKSFNLLYWRKWRIEKYQQVIWNIYCKWY